MKKTTTQKATATATLLIAADPGAELRHKPEFRPEFDISEEAYAQLPPVFTMTELPQPAVVAAQSIQEYDRYLEAIPKDERADYDLDVGDRWGDEDAVRRFINKSLALAFAGEHFTVSESLQHVLLERFYLDIPSYSFAIADASGDVMDFYSAPGGFEQPITVEARVNIMRPALVGGF